MNHYQPLDVIFGGNKVDGVAWYVRDEEHSHLWNKVEYVERRLTCGCPDGEAHAESPNTEPECAHFRAVVDARTAQNTSSRPAAPINVSAWVD